MADRVVNPEKYNPVAFKRKLFSLNSLNKLMEPTKKQETESLRKVRNQLEGRKRTIATDMIIGTLEKEMADTLNATKHPEANDKTDIFTNG